MHLVESYATNCGVKIDKPYIYEKFFPLDFSVLPSTCFGIENMKIYDNFEDLPKRRGYGVVFYDKKEENILKSKNIDWGKISFLSTNSAYNLRISKISNALLDIIQ